MLLVTGPPADQQAASEQPTQLYHMNDILASIQAMSSSGGSDDLIYSQEIDPSMYASPSGYGQGHSRAGSGQGLNSRPPWEDVGPSPKGAEKSEFYTPASKRKV